MQRILIGVGLVALAAVSFQAYRNARAVHPLDSVARDVACGEISRCSSGEIDPSAKDTGPFLRRYQFQVAHGRVEVKCRWSMLMFGPAECVAETEEELGPLEEGNYPDELDRGAPNT